jgi:hypothetical protein
MSSGNVEVLCPWNLQRQLRLLTPLLQPSGRLKRKLLVRLLGPTRLLRGLQSLTATRKVSLAGQTSRKSSVFDRNN